MSLNNQPADQQPADRLSVGRIVRDAIAGLRARFTDVLVLAAILLLPSWVLYGFAADPDTAMIWEILANLPTLVFDGAAVWLMHRALTGAPAAPAGDALRVGLARLSQLFSIYVVISAPVWLLPGLLSLIGPSVPLMASPLIIASVIALNLILIFAQPLVVIEGMPAFAAMALSVRLTKGKRWPLLLVVLLLAVFNAIDIAVDAGGPKLMALVVAKDIAGRITAFVGQPLTMFILEPLCAALVTATYLQLRRPAGAVPMRQMSRTLD